MQIIHINNAMIPFQYSEFTCTFILGKITCKTIDHMSITE